MPDIFRIADIDFKVKTGKLDAYVSETELHWGVEITGGTNSEEFARWEPRITSDVLFATLPNTISCWQDLAPRSAAWTDKNDNDVIPSASLYIFEHTPIYNCRAECYLHTEELRLRMRGRCDVFYSREKYDEDLDLEIDTPLDFVGILCGRSSEEESRQSLAPFLNPDDFIFTQNEKGVSILKPKAVS